MELINNNRCFACGKENPIGLKLEFKLENGKYISRFVPLPEHQGWKGIVHGGIITTVLDEAMGRLMYELKKGAVTGSLKIRLNKPTLVGKEYIAAGWIKKELEKKIVCKATLSELNGEIVAEGEGVMVKIDKVR